MSSSTPDTVQLQFRRTDFKFEPMDSPWLGDLLGSHFFHALSIIIPLSERYVSAVIQQKSDTISDRALKQQAKVFVQQEGRHAYLHQQCNQILLKRYPRLASFQNLQKRFLRIIDVASTNRFKASIPTCFEHITANISRDFLVNQPQWTQGKKNVYIDFTQWHCLEELEHQAICFDVYAEKYSSTKPISFYLAFFWLPITAISLYVIHGYLLFKDKQLRHPKQWWAYLKFIQRCSKILTRGCFGYLRKSLNVWSTQDEALYLERCARATKKES